MSNLRIAVRQRIKRLRRRANVVHAAQQKRLWSKISFPKREVQFVLGLYEKYEDDLRSVREYQKRFYAEGKKSGLNPQLGDVEAEITYLRIREFKPGTVVEFSPASGWSTSWILHALKDNGIGTLFSYDLVDECVRIIPSTLSQGRWVFRKGDVKDSLASFPPNIDYLFVDSDHSAAFARWYIDHVFPRLQPGTPVSVHDIVKFAYEPGWGRESTVLCKWLAERAIDCFTASRALEAGGYREIVRLRKTLGLDDVIHPPDYNSMIYWA